MGKHLVDVFDRAKVEILAADSNLPAFNDVKYGEPRVITEWPMLSIQPQNKLREIGATRKFRIDFVIWVVLYHGVIASTLDIQEGTHKRIEAVESFMLTDLKWNFVDSTNKALDKVIFGYPTYLDHPVVLAPGEELWAASRMELRGQSQEVF
jgi:hypothetical protein